MNFYEYECIGDEELAVAASAVGFALTGLAERPPDLAHCQNRDAQISVRVSGSNPTSIRGTFINENEIFEITGAKDIKAFKAIRTGLTSGKIEATFFRRITK